ncbi:MAG: SsrA-binding protein SmpB [Bacteroidia bacterium]
MSENRLNIVNRKASFEYHLMDKYEAGVQLTGTEIKSIREGKASLSEAYCTFIKDELFIKNMHIAEYIHGTHYNHEPKRTRKLLLKRNELKKLLSKTKEKGLTIIPLKCFISERGFAKIEIALAKGKKYYDKRDSIKQRELGREMNRSNIE